MPLTPKGKKIMRSMKKTYGKKKAEQVFYASKNKGKIKNVDKKGESNGWNIWSSIKRTWHVKKGKKKFMILLNL